MTIFHRKHPNSQFETKLLRDKVHRIIKEKSFEEGGEYILASGKKSNYYLDLKPTLFDPEGSNAVAEMILNELDNTTVDYVGGLATGAIPLASCVTLLSFKLECSRPLPGFFVRDKVKDHGTKKLIEGLAKGESLKGKRVVIVDDVTTLGESAMRAIDAIKDAGAEVVRVIAVVDREEGAEKFFQDQSIPFKALFRASEFRSLPN
jgi:orotate phosphoribosyltransferase